MVLALAESRQRRFGDLRRQLLRQHAREKDLLTQQVVQLEARLVECLRERDSVARGKGGEGCGMGGADVEEILRRTSDSLKRDMMALVSTVGPPEKGQPLYNGHFLYSEVLDGI